MGMKRNAKQSHIIRNVFSASFPIFEKQVMKVPTMGDSITEVRFPKSIHSSKLIIGSKHFPVSYFLSIFIRIHHRLLF